MPFSRDKMPLSARALFAAIFGAAGTLPASILIDHASFSYSQDFNTPSYATEVAAAGTGNPAAWAWANNTNYPGWTRQVAVGGLTNRQDKDFIGEFRNNTIRFGNMGNGVAGDGSLEAGPPTDRSLGLLMEGADGSASFGVVFKVGAGLTVTEALVTYTGEQWFRAPGVQTLHFQCKILDNYDPATFRINEGTDWSNLEELKFSSLKTGSAQKIDGNLGGSTPNRATLSATVSLTATDTQFIAFRWTSVSDGSPAQAALAVDDLTIDFAATKVVMPDSPNFIVIVTDDQRWDATSFMQERMASLGRTARFPYLADPLPMTPNLDRLSNEGIHFDNGFCVYSLCSPSRSVMLTGQYAHRNGVTYNDQEFPLDNVTYASLLRDAGWQTGYFGKWHHGVQKERPGFNSQQSFRGQGLFFGTTFYDENGTAAVSDKWVDEQSTDYLIDFINAKHAAGQPFLGFLGFKTPHGPRQDSNGNSNAPEGFNTLFADDDPVSVPSLLSQGASPPPWKPGANVAGLGNDARNYMRLVCAADAQIGRILDRLTTLGILDNTVVIFLSDNGYFLGEHDLGFLRQLGLHDGDPMVIEVDAGATYPFLLKTSTDLSTWTTASRFEGSEQTQFIDGVLGQPASWDLTVEGDPADHTLIGGNPVSSVNGFDLLGCGANSGVGRNAVLVFALPAMPAGQELRLSQLEVTARRNFAKWWEADLWAIGIKENASPILEYHAAPSDPRPPGIRKLQDAIFDVSLPDTATIIRSSLASGLSAYLREFYLAHPDYSGGQYLFLRINPEKLDMSSEGNERYDVFAAGNSLGQAGPKLRFSFQSQVSEPKRFWRVEYGIE